MFICVYVIYATGTYILRYGFYNYNNVCFFIEFEVTISSIKITPRSLIFNKM